MTLSHHHYRATWRHCHATCQSLHLWPRRYIETLRAVFAYSFVYLIRASNWGL